MVPLAETMLNTDAAKDYFGETLNDNQAYIEHIYENTLGKTVAEDPDGIAYWVSELESGKSKGEVSFALIVAAQDPVNAGDAQDQFNNKVEVSNYTADTLEDFTDTETFAAFIDGVDETDASVTAAMNEVDAEVPTVSDFDDIDMSAGDTYTGIDGVAERFMYDIDSSSGRAVQANGEVVIDGFNIAEDMLAFVDLGAGTITTENFTTYAGVVLSESFFQDNTTIYFDAATAPGGIGIQGVQDADMATIDFTVSP